MHSRVRGRAGSNISIDFGVGGEGEVPRPSKGRFFVSVCVSSNRVSACRCGLCALPRLYTALLHLSPPHPRPHFCVRLSLSAHPPYFHVYVVGCGGGRVRTEVPGGMGGSSAEGRRRDYAMRFVMFCGRRRCWYAGIGGVGRGGGRWKEGGVGWGVKSPSPHSPNFASAPSPPPTPAHGSPTATPAML